MRNLLVFMLLFPTLVSANQQNNTMTSIKDCYYFADGNSFCFHESSIVSDGFKFNVDDLSDLVIIKHTVNGEKNAND